MTRIAPDQEFDIDLDRRFGGVARLYGAAALDSFRASHVTVIGVGGVGSWCAEALARSGVGHLTMIDLDNIHESNMNRQIHALDPELGRAKVVAMAERIRHINPFCQITAIEDFVSLDNLAHLLAGRPGCVIDAIDSVKVKTALIAHCVRERLPVVTVGSAGGKRDPSRVHVTDLSRTEQDPLLAKVRRQLRRDYRFPTERRKKFHVEAVTSNEPVYLGPPQRLCSTEPEEPGLAGLNCAGLGSSVCVTATFGMMATARALERLTPPQ